MKWKKYTIATTTQAEDLISGMLTELGVEGVEIEDCIPITEEEKKQMFIDILPELPPDDGAARVSFYLEEDADTQALLAEIKEQLEEMRAYAPVGPGTIEEGMTDEEDWINNWKQYFQPFAVDDLLIKPSWHEMSEEEKQSYPLVIEIDPGTAFGTGMHETTQLVLRQLRKYVTPTTKLLDVGCGSGILSILAHKLGAGQITGVDIDPAAVEATKSNMESNGIAPDAYRVLCGNLLENGDTAEQLGYGCYDLVAANILADVIIPLAAVIGVHMQPGGYLITSGILDQKEEAVTQALLKHSFEIVEVTRQNDWVSITARKPVGKEA